MWEWSGWSSHTPSDETKWLAFRNQRERQYHVGSPTQIMCDDQIFFIFEALLDVPPQSESFSLSNADPEAQTCLLQEEDRKVLGLERYRDKKKKTRSAPKLTPNLRFWGERDCSDPDIELDMAMVCVAHICDMRSDWLWSYPPKQRARTIFKDEYFVYTNTSASSLKLTISF